MAVKKNFLVVLKMRLKDLVIRAKNWKQSKCPLTAKWIKKLWYRLTGILGTVGIERNKLL